MPTRSKSRLPNKKELKELMCGSCGEYKKETFFYKSYSEIHEATGRIPYCKDCLKNMIVDDYGKIQLESVKKTLQLINKPFIEVLWNKSFNDCEDVFGDYIKKTAMPQYRKLTWEDSDIFNKNIDSFKSNEMYDNIDALEYSDEDLKSKEDTIRLLGYAPFEGYEESDQKYLYNELILFLDEDTLEDPFKIGVVIQIVINNNQIKKANKTINALSLDIKSMVSNAKDIQTLTDMTTKWNQQNDKLSKENNIALKHRGTSSSKNSTLGSMMKNLRELDFERAEHDYYDSCKSYGMKVSADIGNQSILDIIRFDDNDANNIFKLQREKIQELQDKELEYKEEIRKLTCEILKKDKEISNLIEDKKQ